MPIRMAPPFPLPAHMPCPECGASVRRGGEDDHVCEEERLLDYRIIQLREEIARFDDDLVGYLSSPRGKFEIWYAARERSRRRDQA
jgi:hypothetical protein